MGLRKEIKDRDLQIVKMRSEGISYAEIARTVGLSYGRVREVESNTIYKIEYNKQLDDHLLNGSDIYQLDTTSKMIRKVTNAGIRSIAQLELVCRNRNVHEISNIGISWSPSTYAALYLAVINYRIKQLLAKEGVRLDEIVKRSPELCDHYVVQNNKEYLLLQPIGNGDHMCLSCGYKINISPMGANAIITAATRFENKR